MAAKCRRLPGTENEVTSTGTAIPALTVTACTPTYERKNDSGLATEDRAIMMIVARTCRTSHRSIHLPIL